MLRLLLCGEMNSQLLYSKNTQLQMNRIIRTLYWISKYNILMQNVADDSVAVFYF